MRFKLGDISLEEYQRFLESSNYKCIFRHPQFLRVWTESIPGTQLKFLIGDDVVIPGIVFKRGPLKAFYSLPYQTFGGPVGDLPDEIKLDFRFKGFSEVAIDDPELKIKSDNLVPFESFEAILDLSKGYEIAFSRFSPSRRKIIRRVRRNPPLLKEIKTTEDVEVFYPMYRDFAIRKNIQVFPKKFFERVISGLDGRSFGFIAFRDARPVGYILNVASEGRAFALSHVWKEKDISSFLIDLSIRKSEELGFHTYSLGLTSPELRGVLEFKRSFGVNFRPMRTFWKRTFYHNFARNLKTGLRRWLKF